MKRVFVFILFLMCVSGVVAYSQEPEEVYVEVTEINESGPTTRTNIIPITCYYYPGSSSVHITFLSNLGPSVIDVTNVLTNTIDTYNQSGEGLVVIYIDAPAPIVIDIYTGDGKHYRASLMAN